MSKCTFKTLFYIRKNYINKDGETPIMVRITINGKMVQFSSKISVDLKQWNVAAGRVCGKDQAAKETNLALENLLMAIKRHYIEIEQRDGLVDVHKLKDHVLGKGDSNKTLLEIYDKMIEDYEKMAGVTRSAATLQKYKVTRRHIAEFMAKTQGRKDHLQTTKFESKQSTGAT